MRNPSPHEILRFFVTYYGIQPEDGDGIDFYTLGEDTLENLIAQVLTIAEDPAWFDGLKADAKAKGLL